MRWEMKITPVASRREPRDDREEAVAGRDVERRGRLVEDQDPRVPHERAGDAARLPVAERELLDGRVEVGVAPEQLGEHVSAARSRFSAFETACATERVDARARRCRAPSAAPTTSTSWKTVTIAGVERARAVTRARGSAARQLDRRRASGRWTPLRILTSVLLPEPFSPMSAWTSPGRARTSTRLQRLRRGRTPSRDPSSAGRTSSRSRERWAGSRCSRDVATSASWPRPCGARPRAAGR